MKIKIVINCLSARLGGGQTYLKHLLAFLPEHLDLDILVYAPVSLALPIDKRIRRGTTSWPTANPLLRAVWEKIALPIILMRERANLLFCPGGLVSTNAPTGCQTVTMFRNMTPFDELALREVPFGLQRMRLRILKRLMLRSMRQADLTIFISSFARCLIESRIKVRSAETIPHGISAAFRTNGKTMARPGQLPQSKYLLYVSKFDTYKHQIEVVQGFARLPLELRKHFVLVLIGETNPASLAQIDALLREFDIEKKVMLFGAIPYSELPAYYHHAAAILFASSCENCPNILLESLASGRPVLSSNVMPMPEFGGQGIEYFSPFDPGDIANALVRVLTNPVHAEQVATAALLESRKFDWSVTAIRTWEVLAKLALAKKTT
jgi:glycosyltransferase involved in cell wall biosynthesis